MTRGLSGWVPLYAGLISGLISGIGTLLFSWYLATAHPLDLNH